MRKKGKKVIRPAGDELMDYLNRGFAICNRCGTGEKTQEEVVIFTPARPADGRLTRWSTSMRAEIRWSSYRMKEAMTTWSSGTTCRPPGAERAEAHTPTASRRAECSTTKHDQRRGGAL